MKREVQKYLIPAAAVAASIGLGFAGVTAAQTAPTSPGQTNVINHMRSMIGLGQKPGVFGKIASISGSTITVTETNPKDNTTSTYTVDATNAKIQKFAAGAAPTTITVSGLAVGDSVAVRGTVTGTNVVATDVMDGVPAMGGRGMGGPRGGMGVQGTVTAVSGNTVTVTGKDGKTYTVDASGAAVAKTSIITVSQIAVGDTVGVQGTLSGTTVTAKHIMDGVPPQEADESDGN